MRVKYVNPTKKPGGKFGSIKMEDGNVFWVNSGLLNQYSVGMDIDPPFKSERWGDMNAQVIPAHWSPTMNGGAQAPMQNPVYQQPAPITTIAPRQTDPAPPPMEQAMAIFITGVVTRGMGSGKFEVDHVKLLTLAALEAWRELQAKL